LIVQRFRGLQVIRIIAVCRSAITWRIKKH
jgi:hypothetical protein